MGCVRRARTHTQSERRERNREREREREIEERSSQRSTHTLYPTKGYAIRDKYVRS